MTVHKWLIGSTLLVVLALFAGGIYIPDTLIMSMADTTPLYAFLRGIAAILLIALLITSPPRSATLRTTIAVSSAVLAFLTIVLTFNYQIHLLDAVVFLETALIFAIEALEVEPARTIPVRTRRSVPKKIKVVTA